MKTIRTPWKWLGVAALIFIVAAVAVVRFVIARAEPIVRTRVIQTLSTRFKSKVELENFHVSVANGILVSGGGLRVFGATDPNPYAPGMQALISVQEFHFQTGLGSLFRSPMHVDTVYLKGLQMNLPPKENRKEMTSMGSRTGKLVIFVDKFVCEDARLVINTSKPGKPPLEFAIGNLTMKDVGPGQPFQFDASLVNPKPVGNIQSSGLFGPLKEDSPRDTRVQGKYSFKDADLGTLKGIAGTLSSTGEYAGTLDNIVVDGSTNTPDFRIASSGHPVRLRTRFHAIVDGTSGDTYLQPVDASFLHTSLTATGAVFRVINPKGHDIELDVVLNHAQIEDLLTLGVRADPPLVQGPVEMRTRMSLTPGDADVVSRLKLAGSFRVLGAHFPNRAVQAKLDSLSMRSQGRPKEARDGAIEDVPVDFRGTFTLKNGLLAFSYLHFLIPGTHVDMSGEYTLDGRRLDFKGKARMDATLSHMMTGWKSVLLKPVDPFFRKNGAGTEVPIKITGTQSEPHIGLNFGQR